MVGERIAADVDLPLAHADLCVAAGGAAGEDGNGGGRRAGVRRGRFLLPGAGANVGAGASGPGGVARWTLCLVRHRRGLSLHGTVGGDPDRDIRGGLRARPLAGGGGGCRGRALLPRTRPSLLPALPCAGARAAALA